MKEFDPTTVDPAQRRMKLATFMKHVTTAAADHQVLIGWRWFEDGLYVYMEPPGMGIIQHYEMTYLTAHTQVDDVCAVFRSQPLAGIYLCFTFHPERVNR